MNRTKIICGFCLALIFFFNFSLAGLLEKRNVAAGFMPDERETSEINPDATKTEKVLVAPANFILVTDVLDGFGGQRYNGGCDLSIFAGAQSEAIGQATSTNLKLMAGFIYPTMVKCGDSNADGSVSVTDVVYQINFLFKGGPMPKPYEAGEANCDGRVTVSDVIYLINYLFKGGPGPVC